MSMHISLQKSQMRSQLIHSVEHHRVAIWLSLILVLCLTYILHSSVDTASVTSSANVRYLSLLDDPFYAHEYNRRAAYIFKYLKILKDKTRADSAYFFSYRYGSDHPGGMMGLQIAQSFEVGQKEPARHIREYHDLSRTNWLRVNHNGALAGGFLPGSFPKSYGIELYNEQGMAIGYVGMDYPVEVSFLQGQEMSFFRQTAELMKAGLLQSMEHVEKPSLEDVIIGRVLNQ